MPLAPNPLTMIAFKAVGYTAAAFLLKKYYKSEFSALLFALMRVALGVVLGVGAFVLLAAVSQYVSPPGEDDRYLNEILSYAVLACIRVASWGFLIWIVFERKHFSIVRFGIATVLCVLLSFLIDAAHGRLENKYEIMTIGFC